MKLLLIAFLTLSLISCNKDNATTAPVPTVDETATIEAEVPSDEDTIIEEEIIDEEVIEVEDAPEAPVEMVEETTECICTKDFRPVCGANGQTYPNSCQAECDGMTDYKEGACE